MLENGLIHLHGLSDLAPAEVKISIAFPSPCGSEIFIDSDRSLKVSPSQIKPTLFNPDLVTQPRRKEVVDAP